MTVTNAGHVLAGYHAAFATGGLLVLCAAFSALLIRDEDAAATMRPRADAPALAAAGD